MPYFRIWYRTSVFTRSIPDDCHKCAMEKYLEIKKIMNPTKHGSSNRHDPSWSAASACACSPEGRTSSLWNCAPMEDAPKRARTVVVVSATSMLLPDVLTMSRSFC
jgi:hypothetical protein